MRLIFHVLWFAGYGSFIQTPRIPHVRNLDGLREALALGVDELRTHPVPSDNHNSFSFSHHCLPSICECVRLIVTRLLTQINLYSLNKPLRELFRQICIRSYSLDTGQAPLDLNLVS